MEFDVPVVLFVYNRPAKFRRLWSRIATLCPRILYVISDGPRNPADGPLIEECRQLVNPDWPCSLTKIFASSNLGCEESLIRGISQVFANEETGIFLEDDCIPADSFFPYCRELLNRFEDDPQIFSIAGSNQFEHHKSQIQHRDSISFSRYFSSWGWAGWRRTWQICNWNVPLRPAQVTDVLTQNSMHRWTGRFWKDLLSEQNQVPWDYHCAFTALRYGLYTVIPVRNLIHNIGHDNEATHTTQVRVMPEAHDVEFPLRLPARTTTNDDYDRLIELHHTDGRILTLLRNRLALRTRLKLIRELLFGQQPR